MTDTQAVRVIRRTSPRGSRGDSILHLAGVDKPLACGASTTSAASVVALPGDPKRHFLASSTTCTRCWVRVMA